MYKTEVHHISCKKICTPSLDVETNKQGNMHADPLWLWRLQIEFNLLINRGEVNVRLFGLGLVYGNYN